MRIPSQQELRRDFCFLTRNRIASIDGATGLPTDWNPNASGEVNALALSGLTLYVGGAFTAIGDSNRSRIAALHTTTGKAAGWNPNLVTNTGAVVNALAISGSVVYVGRVIHYKWHDQWTA